MNRRIRANGYKGGESTKTGAGVNGHIGWNAWVKLHDADYVAYDNVAIHRKRA